MTPIVNNAMTLYVSNVRGRKFNTSYPFEARIQGVDDLARAAQYDHVCAQYGDAKNRAGETIKAHRGIKDFMQADCAAMDCDNSQPDPMQPDLSPDEWKTPDDVAAAFPGVAFYAVPSRNHMREKDGLPARPKYHYYFPLKHTVKNADSWAALKKGMREHFPAFDENAIDAARFLYGVENPQPVFHAGDLCVDEFMEIQKSAQRARATQEKAAQERRQANSGVIPVGQRNSTLSRFAATVLKKYGTDDGKALEAFQERAAQCEQPLEAKELETIWRSACGNYDRNTSKAPDYISPKEYAVRAFAESLEPADWTDLGQAALFAAEYGSRAKYTPATKWIVYDGKVWQESELKARVLAQELTDRQLEEARTRIKRARKAYDAAVESGDTGKAEEAKKRLDYEESFRGYVLGRRKSNKIAAMLTEAAAMLEIDVALLDHDPYTLNTPAGTVDLKTGQLRPHDPADYCTKITACSPSKDGADIFTDFLKRLTCNDADFERYLQDVAGLCAVGRVMREQLAIATGQGGNGKSTFFNAQRYVFGDYAGSLSSDVLTTNNRANKKPEIAELRGKRLIVAAELEEGQRLDTAMVKKLCSTDPIKGEKKFKDPFDFLPAHTTILFTNHLPKVGTLDNGSWDRLIVLPFKARFRGAKGEILNYGQYLFEHAGGAILQWMIDGARRVIAQGFFIDKPECVKEATREYREDNDWLDAFIKECCDVDPRHVQPSGALYQRYKKYCDDTGEYRHRADDFKKALQNAGFETRKTNTGAIVRGLSVKVDVSGFVEVDEPTPWDSVMGRE